MDAFFYGVADLCEPLFELMPVLGNKPNTFFITCTFIAAATWVRMLVKYRQEGVNE